MILKRYNDFINRVNEIGFMTLSNILPGFPSLSEETPKGIWHTGNIDTDPWCWKDRAAEEKSLAFGCILGKHMGFISARMYSTFFKAFHPDYNIERMREDGIINQTVWQLWQLFERDILLDTSDIRREMGVKAKIGSNKVDMAIKELQQSYFITIAGSRRKMNKYGQPYGWPANIYDKVENWVPVEWMEVNSTISRMEAREIILDNGIAISKNINRFDLAKILGI